MKKQISFKVDSDLKEKVKEKLKKEGRTLKWLGEKSFEIYLNDNEVDQEAEEFFKKIEKDVDL